MTNDELKAFCRQAWDGGFDACWQNEGKRGAMTVPETFEEWWTAQVQTGVDLFEVEQNSEILGGIREVRITYQVGGGHITYTASGGEIEAAQRIRWDSGKAILQLGLRNVRIVRRGGVASRTYDINEVFPR